jgi:D-serine deaminase-like pyridoxal phosphate-dependent protein
MLVREIDTPALVVDLDILERNLGRVAGYARQHGLRLRPHTKTHKSIRLAKRQLESGAVGLTVAKVSEAEVMLGAEPADLLVAFPIIGRAKLERLMEVARRTRVTVALDSVFAARQLSEAARAAQLGDWRAGRGGCGAGPRGRGSRRSAGATGPVHCEASVAALRGHRLLPWAHQRHGRIRPAGLAQLAELLRSILSDFRRVGIEAGIVSGGSTPTLFHSHELEGLTEIRPGTYVFNDINTVRSGACAMEDCAASILATVVSTARSGQMIIDGGSKTFSSDRLVNSPEPSFGHVVEAPGARLHKMNEEHGFIDLTRAEREFSVGDRIHVIPNHICVAVNLHEQVYGIRGEMVEEIWKVDARGKLQ